MPLAALFGMGVWLLAGLVSLQLWPQLACFVATVYLLVELSNQNALMRVRSRMVSTTFIVLSCTASFLLPQLTGGIVQLGFVAAFLLLFQTYQTGRSIGPIFYAFVAVSLASMAFVQTLWYVPVLWVLMGTQLQSLSWRTWAASLLGLALPYWVALLWLIITPTLTPDLTPAPPDLSPLSQHFAQLADLRLSVPQWTVGRILVIVFTLLSAGIGIIHFWQYSFEDKIRIRLLYGFFTAMTAATLFFLVVQPQHCDVLLRLLILCASPLIAHVMTFTSSRLSNILFFVAMALAIALTVFNLGA